MVKTNTSQRFEIRRAAAGKSYALVVRVESEFRHRGQITIYAAAYLLRTMAESFGACKFPQLVIRLVRLLKGVRCFPAFRQCFWIVHSDLIFENTGRSEPDAFLNDHVFAVR